MTQLDLLDAGPGWFSVRVQHADDALGEMGWCRWYESEGDAMHAGEASREGRKGGRVTIRRHDSPPKFALERWDEWSAAAEGVPLSVDEYGRVRNPTTGRRYENE